jgi:hypothetical protein
LKAEKGLGNLTYPSCHSNNQYRLKISFYDILCWACDIYKYSVIVYPIYDDEEVNSGLGYGCYGWGFKHARSFLTKEERIELLKEYQDDLEKEKQGVAQRIRELEAS